MSDKMWFLLCLLTSAGVTYLVRMVPLVLIKKKITNRFIRSFLYYIPYAVLGVMTIPAIFYATASVISAVVGFLVAVWLAWKECLRNAVNKKSAKADFLCFLWYDENRKGGDAR